MESHKIDAASAWADVALVREQSPLVHNITNFVVMNSTANALLAVGASPIMAHALEELDELLAIASALVLNIGTLSAPWIESMRAAGRAARERGLPAVLDPVGAGASRLRTETSLTLLHEARPAVVRGNASEIMALAGEAGQTKGVDSTRDASEAGGPAARLAREHGCVAVASGATDLITDGETIVRITGGHALMPRVTGMGCTATAIIGAFCAVNPDPLAAAAHAMAAMSAAGHKAAITAQGPGSMQWAFLDALHTLTRQDMDSLEFKADA